MQFDLPPILVTIKHRRVSCYLVSFIIVSFILYFIKIETLAQVFSYEFCEISTNPFSYRTPPVAASAEAYSEPCKTLKMVLLAKIVNNWKSLTIFTNALSEMLDRALNTHLLNTRATGCSCLLHDKIYYMFEIT